MGKSMSAHRHGSMTKMNRFVVIFLAALASGCLAPACGHAQNLVTNGGFETGDLTGWTLTPAFNGSLFTINGVSPNSGSFEAAFGATDVFHDVISQNINTVPSGRYVVSFFLKTNTGVSNVNSFTASFGNQTLLNITNQGLTPYTQYSFVTTAPSSSALLQFGGYNNPSFFYLDDVVVEEVTRFMAPLYVGEMGHDLMDFHTIMQDRSDGMGTSTASPSTVATHRRPLVLASTASKTTPPVSTHPYEAWMEGIGDLGSIGGDSNSPSVTKASGGLAAGLEIRPGTAARAGVAFEFLRTDISVAESAGTGTMNTYAVGLYGAHKISGLVVDAETSAAYDTTDDQSNGVQTTSDGYGFGASAGVRYPLKLGSTTVEPRLGLDYAYSFQNGATFSNSIIQSVTADTGQSFLRSTAGARFSRDFIFGGGRLVPEVRAAWAHQMLNPVATVQETIPSVSPASFSVIAPNPGRDAILFGFGAHYVLNSFDLFLRYDGSFSTSASDNAIIGGLRFYW